MGVWYAKTCENRLPVLLYGIYWYLPFAECVVCYPWLFSNCYSVCKLYWVSWGRLLSVWFVTCDCSLTVILYVSYFELPEASCWVSGSWGPGPGAGCSTWSTSHTGCEQCQGRLLRPCMVHCSEGHWPPAARSRTGIYKTEGVQRRVSKETEDQSTYRGIYRI